MIVLERSCYPGLLVGRTVNEGAVTKTEHRERVGAGERTMHL